MADETGITVDTSGITAGLTKLQVSIDPASEYSALDIGNEILRLSQMEVPHDKGTLQNSGAVEQIGGVVIVGYHTPYAARLHEHPEYKFQKGRKGRYLMDPILRNLQILGLKFARNFEEKLH